MDSQKVENQLNLAFNTSLAEREKSENLNVGYNSAEESWELIVRYTGNLLKVKQMGIEVTELLNGYAILNVPERLIDTIINLNEIIYIEKPKRLNFAIDNGMRVSCINSVQEAPFDLRGRGCIVCVIDSGIDYENPVFRDANGNTRILELWDQTITLESNPPPTGYNVGALFTFEDINNALREGGDTKIRIVPSVDMSGHGTAVASIAAGNFARMDAFGDKLERGIATESELIIVKLGIPRENSFPRTSELMQAIDYCVRKGVEYGRPIVINLSFGNNYGSHDGTSLISTYIDSVADVGRSVIVVGTGNEGAKALHTSGILDVSINEVVQFDIGTFEQSISLQLWKNYGDNVGIEIISPLGVSSGVIKNRLGAYQYLLGNTNILLFYGEPSPYSPYQEVYIELIPQNTYIDSGIWVVRLFPVSIIDGKYDMWLSGNAVSSSTKFERPVADTTLTIPSATRKVISVGAYDPLNFTYADFSGRGFTRTELMVKPDIVAPGVSITCAAPGGGLIAKTGTSFATPFVTGAVALMMEWGIIKGNDKYLYGEKVKAYLIKWAKRLDGFEIWPNKQVGWGALCLRDSFPANY